MDYEWRKVISEGSSLFVNDFSNDVDGFSDVAHSNIFCDALHTAKGTLRGRTAYAYFFFFFNVDGQGTQSIIKNLN